MKLGTFLAAVLALCSWTFATSGKALAHGGTDFAVIDCEHDDCDGDKAERTFAGKESQGDVQRTVFDCEDDGCDKDGAVLKCHDDADQS